MNRNCGRDLTHNGKSSTVLFLSQLSAVMDGDVHGRIGAPS